LSASTNLLNYFSNGLAQYATHEHSIREHMKAIRTREESLDELKRRRKALLSKADTAEKKLSKMSPEHKNLAQQTDTLNRLREEIRMMDSEIMTEEAALGDFKRSKTRALMGLKFGGLLECCEKGTVGGQIMPYSSNSPMILGCRGIWKISSNGMCCAE
jgi:prefoldin subunit 5